MLPYQPSSGEVDVVGRVWPPLASHRKPVAVRERASGNVHAEVASSNVTGKVAHDFVVRTSEECATVYTDQADVYRAFPSAITSSSTTALASTFGSGSTRKALNRTGPLCAVHLGVFHRFFTEAFSAVCGRVCGEAERP